MLRPLISGLEYLHSLGLKHLALRPENILFTSDGTLKLGEVLTPIIIPKGVPEEDPFVLKSMQYMPPEVAKHANEPGFDGRCNPRFEDAIDVYAIGVITLELMVGGAQCCPMRAPAFRYYICPLLFCTRRDTLLWTLGTAPWPRRPSSRPSSAPTSPGSTATSPRRHRTLSTRQGSLVPRPFSCQQPNRFGC